jgi:hypothetical protein
MFWTWLKMIALATFVGSMMLAALYQVFRRDHWPQSAAQIKIPKAGWIIAAILAAVAVYLAILIGRDPLKGP